MNSYPSMFTTPGLLNLIWFFWNELCPVQHCHQTPILPLLPPLSPTIESCALSSKVWHHHHPVSCRPIKKLKPSPYFPPHSHQIHWIHSPLPPLRLLKMLHPLHLHK